MGSIFGGGTQNDYQASSPFAGSYGQAAVQNQANTLASQNNLAQALVQQMNGMGPNPAQTQFQANQQGNIANAQGMIASQRGLNPALAARMGVNAAAQGNQQAALGSALLQQQQQLGATANLGNLYGQMQQGELGQQQLYGQGVTGANDLNQKTTGQNTQNSTNVIGGLLNAGGGAIAAGAKGAGGAAHGAYIGGQAKVSGDSPENDTVPAMLSPGEIVIPRSHAHDPEKAKEFVDHLLKSKGKEKKGYGDVVEKRRSKAALEKKKSAA